MTAMLFHEILGIMGIELGYHENVSMYPISSKILPYDAIIASTPITEASIRPEFFGLDSRSYGVTIINKDTNESIRMICLNSNVEIHRCRNYSIVRMANGLQAPLINNVISLSPEQISNLNLKNVKIADLVALESKLTGLQRRGFKYISLRGEIYGEYRFGIGAAQALDEGFEDGSGFFLGLFIGFTEADIVVEAAKQTLNIGIWPIKAVVNSIRVAAMKGGIKRLNRKIKIVSDILNFNNELSLVGTTKKVSDKDFKLVSEMLMAAIVK